MNVFHWQQHHIDWFVRTFAKEQKPISRREVEKRYKPRRGEPKKGRSLQGEKTITVEDFGRLMRLVVTNGHARVISSFSGSKNYRIQMVSEDYPFTEILFDDEIFNNSFLSMPNQVALRELYLPKFMEEWNDDIKLRWSIYFNEGSFRRLAFWIYNHAGGDFDRIFDRDPIEYSSIANREIFVLDVCIYIAVYKALKAGRDELLDYSRRNPPSLINRDRQAMELDFSPEKIYDYKNIFIQSFRSDLIMEFLACVDRMGWNGREVSSSTRYKAKRLFIRQIEASENRYIQPPKTIEGGEYSEETKYRINNAFGGKYIELLKRSNDPVVIEAVRGIDLAIEDRENFKLTLDR
jgi:hypothetical protein